MSLNEAPLQLTTDQTAQLLAASLSQANRPIDVLVDRLSEPDGETWLSASLQRVLDARDIELLGGTSVSEAEIAAVKSRAKRQLAQATNYQEHVAALACYCLSVARGLVSCNRLLSSRSGEEWAEFFADLAAELPAPWRETVSRAAELALMHNPRG